MRWTPGDKSSNIEDRRGSRGGFPIGAVGGGAGGLIILVLSLLFGGDIFGNGGSGGGAPVQTSAGDVGPVQETAAEHKQVQFVSFVLDDAQGVWARTMPALGARYHDAKLVLFRDITQSGCGTAQSATGPFYCPMDEKVYIDLGFMNELQTRFGASGDFAQAYVIAHELGHHVQHILGTEQRVRELMDSRPQQANALSVRLELQADCYAGVWGRSTDQRGILEQGDVDEGLRAAAAVGDDRLQKMTRGTVSPDSFTHGSSAQRASWFKRGFESGDPKSCDTFAGAI